jgi:hypothetical protein
MKFRLPMKTERLLGIFVLLSCYRMYERNVGLRLGKTSTSLVKSKWWISTEFIAVLTARWTMIQLHLCGQLCWWWIFTCECKLLTCALLNEQWKHYHTVGSVLKFQSKEKRKKRQTSIPLAHIYIWLVTLLA